MRICSALRGRSPDELIHERIVWLRKVIRAEFTGEATVGADHHVEHRDRLPLRRSKLYIHGRSALPTDLNAVARCVVCNGAKADGVTRRDYGRTRAQCDCKALAPIQRRGVKWERA